MDIQAQLIAPCSSLEKSGPPLDKEALFRRLLLFDTYILRSNRLVEIVSLVRALGAKRVTKLLDSGALKISTLPSTLAQIGQPNKEVTLEGFTVAAGDFSFRSIHIVNPQERLVKCIDELRRELDGNESRTGVDKLVTAVLNATQEGPPNSGRDALLDLVSELKADSPIFKSALKLKLAGMKQRAETDEPELRIIQVGDEAFRVETNLNDGKLPSEEVYKIVQSAMLAVGNVSLRLEEMRNHQALSGLMDEDLPLFQEKFALLTDTLSPDYLERKNNASTLQAREAALAKALEVRRLPTFDVLPIDRTFNMDRFLEVRASSEAHAFRKWLRGLDKITQKEINEEIGGFKNSLNIFMHSNLGRAVRVAVSFGLGNVSAGGVLPGLAFSVVETFLWDRIFPLTGPLLFLSSQYSSLFEAPRRHEELERYGSVCRMP